MSVELIRSLLPGTYNDPDTNMLDLMEILTPSVIIPDLDKYYVFAYKAKTPRIVYDSNPFVYVNGIYRWGFTGMNLHLGKPRRYTWQEVITNLYTVTEEEVPFVLKLPTTNIKTT